MSAQRFLLEQRKNTEICLQILLQCETRQQTIDALKQIAGLLRSADDPMAEAAEPALQLSHTSDEAWVLQARDEFIRQLRAYLAATDSMAQPTTEPAKPKRRMGFRIVKIGLLILVVCLIAAVALVAVLVAMEGSQAHIPVGCPTLM